MQSWMIGMVSGIVFTGWWPALPPWYLSLVFAGVAAILLHCRNVLAGVVGGLALGCALGLVYGTVLLQHRLADECVGVPLIVSGTVASLPSAGPVQFDRHRQRFVFSVSQIAPVQCAGPTRLVLSYYGSNTIKPGDRWRFEVKLRKPWGLANPGSFNLQVWFAQEAIDAVGSVRESGKENRLLTSGGVYTAHHRLRLKISEHIARLQLDPDVEAILRAITVADKDGIDPRLWRLFQQYGISHLLVISGLHVGMVAAVGYLLGGLCVRIFPRMGAGGGWLPGALALLFASLYGAMAGFSLPTLRALCMLGCFVIAGLSGRRSGSANNLLVAATLVLALNPLAALGSGFWLSFGAVAALLWFSRWQQGSSTVARLLGTHGYMSLAMLPMGTLFFGGGSMVAMFANLLMIPLIGWLVVPMALLAAVCAVFGWPMAPALWQLAAWPLAKLLPAARWLADTGDHWLYIPLSASLPQVLLAVLAVTLLILPGRSLVKPLALLLAGPMLLPALMHPQSPSLETEVTVLDVGQGTAVLVQSGSHALLYDVGGGDPRGTNMASMAVLPYLRQQGVTSLDTLVVSHPDVDHSAGTRVILGNMMVERFRYGGKLKGVRGGRPCIAGESWRWPGGQEFQFMSPALETHRKSNDSSCVLQVQVGNYRMLLPGDIEEGRERSLVQYWGDQLSSNWLLVAHHGSRTSSSQTFLKRVQPTASVISSGYANPFGHPHHDIVQRLHSQGSRIFSTATGGALAFKVAPGQSLAVSAYRQTQRRYWM